MKRSTKRFCFKMASGILSTILATTVALPMQVFATAIDSTQVPIENSSAGSIYSDYSENIIRELEEERNEFSKTFLMTDGTYYTYMSPVPIHEFVEDRWVNIDDSLSDTPATISEAESVVKDYVEEVETASSQISTFALHEYNNAITVTCIGNSTQTATGYTLPANSALVIKPEVINKFSMANKVLISATLSTNISYNSINKNRPLYLKHITSEVTSETTYADIDAYSNIYYKRYNINETSYSFDITDIYSKWERSNTVNNGVALVGNGLKGTPLQLTTPVLSIRYKDITANDSSFTYHTLDLGRAGVLFINDVTNAFKLEQTVAGIDCSLLPVTLTKTIDSTKFSLNSYVNVSSEWNYDYTLAINGTYATLTLPQGTKIEFRQPENTTAIDGYQVWNQITNEDYVDGVSLYVTETAANSGGIGNVYQNCHVDIDGIEYWFNAFGRLKYIEKANKRLNISYDYSNEIDAFVISKLTDAVGNQYNITYSTYNVNNIDYLYASKIAVKDSDNNAVTFDNAPLEINISNTVQNSIITSTYSYPSEANLPIAVSYNYDLNGKLLSIQSTDGTVTQLHYKSADNTYLTGYTQTKNDEVINDFTISSNNTFERVFEGTLIQKEIQRYDSDFQLATYYYGDNIVSMTYDNGTVDSYAVNNLGYTENQNLVDNGDFSQPLIDSNWFEYSTSLPDYDKINKRAVIENDTADTVIGISQFIESLSADTTYIFSGEVSVVKSIPSDDYAFNTVVEIYSKTGDLLKTLNLPFDVSLLNETQTRMCAFKTDVDCDVLISVYAEGNVGKFYVDNIRLYEASTEDGSVAIPGISTSNPITQTTTEEGLVTKESISDGIHSMIQEYEYSSDGSKLLSNTDFNGIATYFDYSGRAGVLSEKGYTLGSDNSITDPICYNYNRAGLLKTVTQTITGVTGNELELLAEYTYDSSDRITAVSNNDYSYTFDYDELGNITNIKKEITTESGTQSNNLIGYNYTNNNIGSIEYSNGYKLLYSYGNNDVITEITCQKLDNGEYSDIGSYTYTYENGEIIDTLISSNDLSYDVKVSKTPTGTDIYHIFGNDSTLVYSKSKAAENTVEKYISSVSGSDVLETFTRTDVTETVIGNTTELYSAFSGTKYSAAQNNNVFDVTGSNNTVKDYFGRVSSKYFTLESEITNISTDTVIESSELSLTHNYSYLTVDDSSSPNVTSNLIKRVDNIFAGENTSNGTTTQENGSLSYNYIYDCKGNIRFVYVPDSDGDYYLIGYYEYDEANQITASFGPNGVTFFSYDYDGNIIEKTLGGDVTVVGVDSATIENIEGISSELWNTFDWSAFDNMTISTANPEKRVIYSYDSFDRLIKYVEKSYTYDPEGNATETVDVNLDIPYDDYGNPLKYVGDSEVDGTVIADLIWNGTQLESAIIYDGNNSTPDQKLTFKYDENGYRINKTSYNYSSSDNTFTENMQTNYLWDNGNLMGMQLAGIEDGTAVYMYTNILYDNDGVPYGIVTPTGLSYYFLRDSSDSVCGLVGSNGEVIAYFIYDAFGGIYMDIQGSSLGDYLVNAATALYNPCTYKGYLYDYELGMYFIQNQCYSPKFGRFLSESNLEDLSEPTDNALDINTHLFCNNNPVNNFNVNAEWDRDKFSFTSDKSHGIQVEMSRAFLSRPFCTLYASKIISDSGSWDYLNGRSFKTMGIERIASNLFARCVGNYAESAVNRVNATWGDGWIVSNRNSDIIVITENDPNADKYFKIWLAAPSIKAFAAASGIYITL